MLEDDRSPPPSGTARLRMVHAAPNVPAYGFSVLENGGGANFSATLTGVGSTSSFFSAPAGDYTIEILPPSGPPITLNETLQSGIRYLVVATNSVAFIVTDS